MDPLEAHLRRQTERSRNFFWHRVRWKVVSEHLPKNRAFELVDVGAGAGLLGEFLRRERPRGRYRFVEPLETMEAYLEGSFGADANVRHIDSYSGIEFVTLLDVLEHQDDDRAFLSNLFDRMEPGALLLLTVPALRVLWSGWDVALGHHRRYDRASLRRSLVGLPVKVLEMTYLFPELIPAAWVRTLTKKESRGETSEAAFPDLPSFLNDALYLVGSGSIRLRRWWPAGTSLFAAIRRMRR